MPKFVQNNGTDLTEKLYENLKRNRYFNKNAFFYETKNLLAIIVMETGNIIYRLKKCVNALSLLYFLV